MKDTDIEIEQLSKTIENEELPAETEQEKQEITIEEIDIEIEQLSETIENEKLPAETEQDTAAIEQDTVLPVKIELPVATERIQDTITLIPRRERDAPREEYSKNELMSGSVVYISGKKYVMYKVEQGDNLFQIATKFKPVTMEEIMSANHLKETSVLLIGQMLRIPIY
jgi:LysM repeat protein